MKIAQRKSPHSTERGVASGRIAVGRHDRPVGLRPASGADRRSPAETSSRTRLPPYRPSRARPGIPPQCCAECTEVARSARGFAKNPRMRSALSGRTARDVSGGIDRKSCRAGRPATYSPRDRRPSLRTKLFAGAAGSCLRYTASAQSGPTRPPARSQMAPASCRYGDRGCHPRRALRLRESRRRRRAGLGADAEDLPSGGHAHPAQAPQRGHVHRDRRRRLPRTRAEGRGGREGRRANPPPSTRRKSPGISTASATSARRSRPTRGDARRPTKSLS